MLSTSDQAPFSTLLADTSRQEFSYFRPFLLPLLLHKLKDKIILLKDRKGKKNKALPYLVFDRVLSDI